MKYVLHGPAYEGRIRLIRTLVASMVFGWLTSTGSRAAVSQLELSYDLEYFSDSEGLHYEGDLAEQPGSPVLEKSGDQAGLRGSAGYSGVARYGSLRASSRSSFNGDAENGYANAGSAPAWMDHLTVTSSGVPGGTSGRIFFTYQFTVESISSAAHPDAHPSSAGALWDLDISVGELSQTWGGYYDPEAGVLVGDPIRSFSTVEFDFTWGIGFDFSTYLGAYTGVNVASPEWAVAEISNMALSLTGMGFKADDGAGGYESVDGASVVVASSSGASYSELAVVPEPASATIVALALAGALARRRRVSL